MTTGMRVVCIDDKVSVRLLPFYIFFPVQNGIYTIRGMSPGVNPDGQEEITVYLEGLENPRSEVAPHRERGYNIERFREMTEVELKKLALLEAEHGPCLPMAFVIWRPGMGLGDDDDDPSERWKKG